MGQSICKTSKLSRNTKSTSNLFPLPQGFMPMLRGGPQVRGNVGSLRTFAPAPGSLALQQMCKSQLSALAMAVSTKEGCWKSINRTATSHPRIRLAQLQCSEILDN